MANDVTLDQVEFIPKPLVKRLGELEIRTLRQLAARLGPDKGSLQEYLGLDPGGLDRLRSQTQARVRRDFPEFALPTVFPRVHKRGVAIHRLKDASRPRFRG